MKGVRNSGVTQSFNQNLGGNIWAKNVPLTHFMRLTHLTPGFLIFQGVSKEISGMKWVNE